jgi:hypothetical protein
MMFVLSDERTFGYRYGTPSIKVRKKSFCRLWSGRECDRNGVHDTDVLVVFCDLDEKEALIDSSSGVLFKAPPTLVKKLDES